MVDGPFSFSGGSCLRQTAIDVSSDGITRGSPLGEFFECRRGASELSKFYQQGSQAGVRLHLQ